MPRGREEVQGVQETPRVETEVIEVTETVEDAPAESSNEEKTPESPRETAEKAYRELERQVKSDLGNKNENLEAEQTTKAPGAKKPELVENAEDYEPPARLSIREKETFNRLPKELKPAVARLFRDHEARFTKTQQEASRLVEENRSIWDAVRPYASSIASRNMTVPQALSGLLESHKALTNPETALNAWATIGAQIGIKPEKLGKFLSEIQPELPHLSGASQPQQRNPEYEELRQKYEALESRLKKQDDEAFQSSVAPIIAEGQAVAKETDSSGRYLYPELHDPETFSTRVKPLVSAYAEIFPNLTYGQLLKKAVHEIRGGSKDEGNFGALNQTRFTAQTNNRAQAASASVRGRSAPSSVGQTLPDKIPDGARDTVALAMEMLRRGV